MCERERGRERKRECLCVCIILTVNPEEYITFSVHVYMCECGRNKKVSEKICQLMVSRHINEEGELQILPAKHRAPSWSACVSELELDLVPASKSTERGGWGGAERRLGAMQDSANPSEQISD